MKADGYDLDSPPIELRQSRWKTALVAVFSLGMALAFAHGRSGLVTPVDKTIGGLFLVIVGFMAANAATGLVRPRQLTICPTGLSLRGAFRARTWTWSDLHSIGPVKTGAASTVGFESTNPSNLNRLLAGLVSSSYNDGLPGLWPIGAERLSLLLNEAKERWG